MPSISDLNFNNALKLQPGDAGSLFGELTVVERYPIIELNGAYGQSLVRDVGVPANGGSSSNATSGEILLETGTTANGSYRLKSGDNGRYVPGYGAQFGCGTRIPTHPTGNQFARWGGLTIDGDDGYYFGMDADGVYVARRKNGTEQDKTYQENWNIDRMDGTGTSEATLDMSDGVISQVDFTYYGYGLILFSLVEVRLGTQRAWPVHWLRVRGETSLDSPNLQVFAEVDNGGDTSNLEMYVGGRQYSIIGNYVPAFRFSGEYRAAESTSTDTIPLLSFRAKAGFLDRSIRIDGIDLIPASEPVIAELRLNGTLTGASYANPTNHTAAETACEVDTSATAISGGVVLWSDYFAAGQANKGQLSSAAVDIPVPEDQPLSLCVRTPSGSGSCAAFMRMREEW